MNAPVLSHDLRGSICRLNSDVATIADIAADSDGTIYVVDNGGVRRISTDGIIHHFAGGTTTPGAGFSGDGGPASNARLFQPKGVAIDRNGNVYITDTGNQRVRRVDKKTQIVQHNSDGRT